MNNQPFQPNTTVICIDNSNNALLVLGAPYTVIKSYSYCFESRPQPNKQEWFVDIFLENRIITGLRMNRFCGVKLNDEKDYKSFGDLIKL